MDDAMIMIKRFLLVAVFLLSCTTSWAGTAYYADPTATSSTNVGTFANPFKTTAAINAKAFSAGDDLYFKVGTTWSITERILIDWHGTEVDPVVIGAYYGEGLFGLNGNTRPIFDGASTYPTNMYQFVIQYIGPGYVIVENLHIKRSYGGGINVGEVYYSDLRVSTGNIVRNNIVEDSGRQGICLSRCSYSLAENNLVSVASLTPELLAAGVVRYGGAGLELTGQGYEHAAYNVLRGNTVRRCNESIGIYRGTRYATVENNTVYDVSQVAIYSGNARDGIIRNNVLYMVDPEDSLNWRQPERGRGSGIWIDSEDNVASSIRVTGGWQIYGNYIAGFQQGVWIQSNSNDLGVYQINNKIHDNRIVDCDRNIWVHQAVTGWTGNEIYDNYSFIYTSGLVHVLNESPIGVTWTGNHYNTIIDGVSGNAATSAVYDDPDLTKTTGWRALPVDGSVDSTWFTFDTEPSTPPSESALNAANTYGGATYTPTRAFLFDDATGTTLTDHSATGADATLTNPSWTDNGLTMNAIGQLIAAPMPNLGATWSVFWAWTSTETYAGDYAKFWYYYNTSVRDWQLERYTSDTEIRNDIGGSTDYTVAWTPTPDTHDQYFHTGLMTYNDTANERCLYIDGNLQSCSSTAFASPTWTGNFYIGGKSDGSRIINATLHAFYIWPNVLTSADAAALHADYDQLFTDPPSRTFNTGTPAAPGPLRRVTTTISTMPMVTTRSQ